MKNVLSNLSWLFLGGGIGGTFAGVVDSNPKFLVSGLGCLVLWVAVHWFSGVELVRINRPRRRLAIAQVERILLVSMDSPQLLALIDHCPAAAEKVLNGAYQGKTPGDIAGEALPLMTFPENYKGHHAAWLGSAIQQAEKLYPPAT